MAQRLDCVDYPPPAQRPVDVAVHTSAPAGVDRQKSPTVEPDGPYRSRKAPKPFLIDCVVAKWRPDKIFEVSFQQMFGTKSPDRFVVLHHTGNSKIPSNRRDFNRWNAGGNHVLRQFFPMSDKRKYPVSSPSDRDCG